MIKKNENIAVALTSSAQDFTASWVDLGDEIDCRNSNKIAIWLDVDINNSVNARVRVLAKPSNGAADEFVLPIKTVSANDIKVEGEYIEFNVDADQKMILSVDINKIIPFVQVQISAGTAGSPAGAITKSYVSWSE